ncbi:hypothetical protein ACT7DN_11250 [Bacillus paranthracis]
MITQEWLKNRIKNFLHDLKQSNAIYEYPLIVTDEELVDYIVFDVFYRKYQSTQPNTKSIYEVAQNISEAENMDFDNVNRQLLRTVEKFGLRKEFEYKSFGEVPKGAFRYEQTPKNRRKHQLTPYQIFQLIQLNNNKNLKNLFEKDFKNSDSITNNHVKELIKSFISIYKSIEVTEDLNCFERIFHLYQVEQTYYLNLNMMLLKSINKLKCTSAERKEIIKNCRFLKMPFYNNIPAHNRLINTHIKLIEYLEKDSYSKRSFVYLAEALVNISGIKFSLAVYFFGEYRNKEFDFESFNWGDYGE